jgi:hypothetical protein
MLDLPETIDLLVARGAINRTEEMRLRELWAVLGREARNAGNAGQPLIDLGAIPEDGALPSAAWTLIALLSGIADGLARTAPGDQSALARARRGLDELLERDRSAHVNRLVDARPQDDTPR